MNSNKFKSLKEATSSSVVGKYRIPVVLSPQLWEKNQLAPFTDSLYNYVNAELAYEEADGDFNESPEIRKRIEDKTRRIASIDKKLRKDYHYQNDDDGSNLGQLESKSIIKDRLLKEDLAVWFGTKKKPKGSSQPKGPWVNICRKDENGKHPPCGRSEAKDSGYPKCRAVGVASKMSDSQKKSACQQKRQAEKSHNKSGKGNSPKMVKYEPKEEMNLTEIIRRILYRYS